MAENAIVKIESLAIQKIDPAKVLASLKESGLRGFNPFSFDQVRVPGAGSLSYTVPTENGPTPLQYMDAIILHFHETRIFYREAYDPKNPQSNPPDCASYDGLVGVGDPGGTCAQCPFAAYQGGCNAGYFTYLLFPDRTLPVKFNVPRTSVVNFEVYFGRVGMSGNFMNQIVTRIGLEKRKTGQGMVATFKVLQELQGPAAASARSYAQMIATSLVYPTYDGGKPVQIAASPPRDDSAAPGIMTRSNLDRVKMGVSRKVVSTVDDLVEVDDIPY